MGSSLNKWIAWLLGYKKYSCARCGSTGYTSTAALPSEEVMLSSNPPPGNCPECNGLGTKWKRV